MEIAPWSYLQRFPIASRWECAGRQTVRREAVAPAECKVVAMVKPALVVERLALAVANVVLAAAELGTVDAAEGRTAGILVVY